MVKESSCRDTIAFRCNWHNTENEPLCPPSGPSCVLLLVTIIHLYTAAVCDLLFMLFKGMWIYERHFQRAACFGFPSRARRGPRSPSDGSPAKIFLQHYICYHLLKKAVLFITSRRGKYLRDNENGEGGSSLTMLKKKEEKAEEERKERLNVEQKRTRILSGCESLLTLMIIHQQIRRLRKLNISNGKRTNHRTPESITVVIWDLKFNHPSNINSNIEALNVQPVWDEEMICDGWNKKLVQHVPILISAHSARIGNCSIFVQKRHI